MKLITVPAGAEQHRTAGPYSPVLEVKGDTLVVISGQAAVDMDGKTIGSSIEEQTIATLHNCEKQLATAGCTLDNIFKVTAYMKDLNDWPRFNKTYEQYMKHPFPARTAIEVGLLNDFLIEIEMWAVKEDVNAAGN